MILTGCCLSAITLLPAQTQAVEFERFTLDNGLKVILHQDNSSPVVAITVNYHVGSKNEDPERRGFAHFFEHLLFEGSENIDRGEFDGYVNNAGGKNNAFTTQDQTFYFDLLPSNQLELGLWLESERMLHAKVEQKGIDVQREVVKEERRQRYENQPYGSFLLEMMPRMFQEHPYQWPPIGYMEDLNAASEADYVNFYETFYVPNNAILCVAGDIDIEETKSMVDKYFSTIPRGKKTISRPDVEEPPLASVVRDTVYDNIQLPAVVQGFRLPKRDSEDFYAVDLLTKLLSTGESSRLYQALVDEQQKALFVGAFPLAAEDPGAMITFGICNMGVNPQEMEAAIDAEIEQVQNELISETEYKKLLNQTEDDLISQRSSMQGIAQALSDYELFYGDANLINTELERYRTVTREDIRKAAQEYFTLDKRVVLYYLPKAQ